MPPTIAQHLFDRRTVLKGAAAAGALQVASPFIIAARGETPIRIGMVDPFTGVYAAVAQNELIGAKLAVEQIMRRAACWDVRSNCSWKTPQTTSAQAFKKRAS